MNLLRKSVRAIIFKNDSIVSMYREKNGRVYYTFPGGGIDEGETEEECVIRECFEEFGLNVKPLKKVYIWQDEKTYQSFYVASWLSGEIGDGKGEEYELDRNRGVYIQSLIKIKDIKNLPLMPPKIAKLLIDDYQKNGEELRKDVKMIEHMAK